ncbi:PREDICTED: uncharacterized protein LOC109181101 [Ipomoea nil]|uniref:uncharacterized protein LOC109181101 n=1 Tax=Ipomoea nil TaxID=35883 RepID=UPI0009013721|nr:PREDICTED: uncharacterized protein LOC109181101 [Ipomoea nil]
MQALKPDKIIDEVFVPTTSSSPSDYILGPCADADESPSKLASRYPLHEGGELLLHSLQPELFKNDKPFRLWPFVNVNWANWVNRVEKEKWKLWKSIGIYDAIQLSKIEIPKDKNLLYAALCFWSSSHNAFHFRFGMMSPTVVDIVSLTGLRPHGDEAFALRNETNYEFPRTEEGEEIFAYGKFLEASVGKTGTVTEHEHVSFLIMWLSKFVFCDTSERISRKYAQLAFALATGKKLGLAPLVLCHLYHTCKGIVGNKFGRSGGPFWILQLWLHSYFPEVRPKDNGIGTDDDKISYGVGLARGQLQPRSFSQYFKFFYTCPARTATQFIPHCTVAAPKWFQESLYPNSAKGSRKELVDMWGSYFVARTLSLCLAGCPRVKSGCCKCGVEYYSPNQFARQLGMRQGVPLPPLQSATHSSAQVLSRSVKTPEEANQRFEKLRRKFSFLEGGSAESKCSKSFESWWMIYVAKTWTKSADDILDRVFPLQGAIPVAIPLCINWEAVKLQDPSCCSSVKVSKETSIKKKGIYEGLLISSLNESEKGGYDEQGCSHEMEEKPSMKAKRKFEHTSPLCHGLVETSSSHKTDGDTSVSDGIRSFTSPLPYDKDVGIGAMDEVTPADPSSEIADFFSQVATQLKQAQTADVELPSLKKPRHSAESIAKSRSNVHKFLQMPFEDAVLPDNRSALDASIPIYAASPNLPVSKTCALKKLKLDLPLLCSDFYQAKKDHEEYRAKVAEKVSLVDELTKAEESHTFLKNKLEKLNIKILQLKESLKEAEKSKEDIEKQQLNLKNSCSPKLDALNEVNAKFCGLEKKKEEADSVIAQVEASWADIRLKITDS